MRATGRRCEATAPLATPMVELFVFCSVGAQEWLVKAPLAAISMFLRCSAAESDSRTNSSPSNRAGRFNLRSQTIHFVSVRSRLTRKRDGRGSSIASFPIKMGLSRASGPSPPAMAAGQREQASYRNLIDLAELIRSTSVGWRDAQGPCICLAL